MSWQKIAEDVYLAYCKRMGGEMYEDPLVDMEELGDDAQDAWELAARQAVWSYQMGMLQKDPELMVVLTPEMKQG